MKISRIPVAIARRDFAKLLERAGKRGSRVKVTRYGTTLAGIISRADLHRLQECDDLLAHARPPKARRRKAASARKPR
jgi:prevent-host-death family protein